MSHDSTSLRLRVAELIIGAQRISSVYCRGSTSHVDGKSDRFSNLLAGGPVLVGHFGMKSDTAVTVDRDADCQRHQLLGLGVDGLGWRSGCGKCAKRFHQIWRTLAQQSHSADHVVSDLHEILAHRENLPNRQEPNPGLGLKIDFKVVVVAVSGKLVGFHRLGPLDPARETLSRVCNLLQ